MKKILIISYFFPPLNTVASSRMYAFARYLGEFGHDVTVLTAAHSGAGCSFPVESRKYREITAVCVDHRERNAALLEDAGSVAARKSFDLLRFRLKKIVSYKIIGNILTTGDAWYFKARRIAQRLMEEYGFDVVISSFSPISTHLIALSLKRRYPALRWIADYRDLWSLNRAVPSPLFPLSLIQRGAEGLLNLRADGIITVSEPLRDTLAAAFKRPAFVVENGYFPEDGERVAAMETRFARKFTFSYTGSIYRYKQDPTPFFIALQELMAEGRIAGDEVEVRFYGDNSYLLQEKVRGLGLDGIVRLFPLVSRDESCAIQKHSTGLLFLESDHPASRGVLTGKLFEYLVAGRPIIAVGISEGHAAGKLIKETGTGYVCGNDIAGIKAAILAVLGGKALEPDREKIALYRRDRLVKKLDGIIREICDPNP